VLLTIPILDELIAAGLPAGSHRSASLQKRKDGGNKDDNDHKPQKCRQLDRAEKSKEKKNQKKQS
jgi:hypothetical protein